MDERDGRALHGPAESESSRAVAALRPDLGSTRAVWPDRLRGPRPFRKSAVDPVSCLAATLKYQVRSHSHRHSVVTGISATIELAVADADAMDSSEAESTGRPDHFVAETIELALDAPRYTVRDVDGVTG